MRKYLFRELALCDAIANSIEQDMEMVALESVWEPALEGVGDLIGKILEGMLKILTFIPNLVKKLIEKIRDSISKTKSTRDANLQEKIKNMPDNVKKYAEQYAEKIQNLRKLLMKNLDTTASNALGSCDKMNDTVGTFLEENLPKIEGQLIIDITKHTNYDKSKIDSAIDGIEKSKSDLETITKQRDELQRLIKEYLGHVGEEWFGYSIEPYTGDESNSVETRLNEISEKSSVYSKKVEKVKKIYEGLGQKIIDAIKKQTSKDSAYHLLQQYQGLSKLCNDIMQVFSTACGLVYVSFSSSVDVKGKDEEGKSNSFNKVGYYWSDEKGCWCFGAELKLANGKTMIQQMHLNNRKNKDQQPTETPDSCGKQIMDHYNQSHSGNERAKSYSVKSSLSTKVEQGKAIVSQKIDGIKSEQQQKKYNSLSPIDQKLYDKAYSEYTGKGYEIVDFNNGVMKLKKDNETIEVQTWINHCDANKSKLSDEQMTKLKEGIVSGVYKIQSSEDVNDAAEKLSKENSGNNQNADENKTSKDNQDVNNQNNTTVKKEAINGKGVNVSSSNPNAEKSALYDYDQAKANYENFKYTETSKVMQDYEKAKRNLDSDEGKRYLKKRKLNYQAMLNKLNRRKEAQIGVINVTKNSNNADLKKKFFETMKRDGYLSDNKYKELTRSKRLKTMSLDEFKKYASNYAQGKRAIESVIADIDEGYDMALESMIDDLLYEEPVLPELDALESFTYETEEDMDKWDNFLT